MVAAVASGALLWLDAEASRLRKLLASVASTELATAKAAAGTETASKQVEVYVTPQPSTVGGTNQPRSCPADVRLARAKKGLFLVEGGVS